MTNSFGIRTQLRTQNWELRTQNAERKGTKKLYQINHLAVVLHAFHVHIVQRINEWKGNTLERDTFSNQVLPSKLNWICEKKNQWNHCIK